MSEAGQGCICEGIPWTKAGWVVPATAGNPWQNKGGKEKQMSTTFPVSVCQPRGEQSLPVICPYLYNHVLPKNMGQATMD